MLGDKFGWDRFNHYRQGYVCPSRRKHSQFSKTGAAKEVPELENEKQIPDFFFA